jgi:hypothetical protein
VNRGKTRSRAAGQGKISRPKRALPPDQLIRTSKEGRIRLIEKRLPRLTAVAKRKAR